MLETPLSRVDRGFVETTGFTQQVLPGFGTAPVWTRPVEAADARLQAAAVRLHAVEPAAAETPLKVALAVPEGLRQLHLGWADESELWVHRVGEFRVDQPFQALRNRLIIHAPEAGILHLELSPPAGRTELKMRWQRDLPEGAGAELLHQFPADAQALRVGHRLEAQVTVRLDEAQASTR